GALGGVAVVLGRAARGPSRLLGGGGLGVGLRAVLRAAALADGGARVAPRSPAVGARPARRSAAGDKRGREDGHPPHASHPLHASHPPHALTSFSATARCALRRVRSATSPASCPQAAAMSSPRVLRVVTVRPARRRISANWAMRAGA